MHDAPTGDSLFKEILELHIHIVRGHVLLTGHVQDPVDHDILNFCEYTGYQ